MDKELLDALNNLSLSLDEISKALKKESDEASKKRLADLSTQLAALEKDGLAADTIVFFFSDHGAGMPRCKRTPCNSGLRVPLIVHFPDKWKHLAPRGYAPHAPYGGYGGAATPYGW